VRLRGHVVAEAEADVTNLKGQVLERNGRAVGAAAQRRRTG